MMLCRGRGDSHFSFLSLLFQRGATGSLRCHPQQNRHSSKVCIAFVKQQIGVQWFSGWVFNIVTDFVCVCVCIDIDIYVSISVCTHT